MIKQGMSNYFKCLKFFFISIGTIALFFVFALSTAVPQMANSVNDLVQNTSQILGQTAVNWDAFQASITHSLQEVDFSNITNALSSIMSSDWLDATMQNALTAAFPDIGPHMSEIDALISTTVGQIAINAVYILIFTILGALVGLIITQWQVRKEMVKSSFIKRLLVSILDLFVYAILIVASIYLASVWNFGFYLAILFSLLLVNIFSLLESYLISARKKAKFREVFNFKNIFKLLVVDILIFIFTIAIILLVSAISNGVVAIYVAIPLIEISFVVIQLNAESYVNKLVKDRNKKDSKTDKAKTLDESTEKADSTADAETKQETKSDEKPDAKTDTKTDEKRKK